MEKLPLLQKLLGRGTNNSEEYVIIKNGCYSGVNFILMVREQDKDDKCFVDTIKNKFNDLMESDFYLQDVLDGLIREDGIFVKEHFFLERIMFIVFKKEL